MDERAQQAGACEPLEVRARLCESPADALHGADPEPLPRVFGYHELFHVLTVAAAACQYGAVSFYVLPRA
jgi:hypothetical protein